jgi:hypothetical protein
MLSGRDKLGGELHIVELHARRGASSVTGHQVLIADAVELAVLQWENRVLKAIAIQDLAAWAFRVGGNAAKRLGCRRRVTSVEAGQDSTSESSFEVAFDT